MGKTAQGAPKYRSTRGAVKGASFEDVVMGGLAPDKGLYVPEVRARHSRPLMDLI